MLNNPISLSNFTSKFTPTPSDGWLSLKSYLPFTPSSSINLGDPNYEGNLEKCYRRTGTLIRHVPNSRNSANLQMYCKHNFNFNFKLSRMDLERVTSSYIFIGSELPTDQIVSAQELIGEIVTWCLVDWLSRYLKFLLLKVCKLISLAPFEPVGRVSSDGFRYNCIFLGCVPTMLHYARKSFLLFCAAFNFLLCEWINNAHFSKDGNSIRARCT